MLGADGQVVAVDPIGVIFNPATLYEVPHMFIAAYMVTGFLLASVYAVGLLRGRTDRYVRLGFAIPFAIAAIVAPVQVVVGDVAARAVLEDQPAKFAAMELIGRPAPTNPRRSAASSSTARWSAGLAIPAWPR